MEYLAMSESRIHTISFYVYVLNNYRPYVLQLYII